MRTLKLLLIYEWETSDPDKGFNERDGDAPQIRYQLRKSEWKTYGPPWKIDLEGPVNMIPFYKNHGFDGEWSNVIESTYDLLRILGYCVSDEMQYTPETKEHIQALIDWFNSCQRGEGELTYASNFP